MRGQRAIEYITTYGWIVLVILIVGGLFYYYGIAPSEGCSGIFNIAGEDWTYSKDGSFVFRIQNKIGQSINITSIEIRSGDVTKSSTTNMILPLGEKTKEIVITGLPEGSEGDPIAIDLEIKYLVPVRIGGENSFSCKLEGNIGNYASSKIMGFSVKSCCCNFS